MTSPISATNLPPPIDTIQKVPVPIFHTVYFDFNSFGLNPMATKKLDQFFASLDQFVFDKVIILGYADRSGKSDYNLDLSKKRAANVAKYLRLNGVNSEEMLTFGKGEDHQFDTNQLNRRVEIQFVCTK